MFGPSSVCEASAFIRLGDGSFLLITMTSADFLLCFRRVRISLGKTNTLRPIPAGSTVSAPNTFWTSVCCVTSSSRYSLLSGLLNEEYAIRIAREWNVPASGAGYVTKFDVDAEYLSKFDIQNVGGSKLDELWIPSEELEEFNSHIVGRIEVIKEFHQT